MDEQVATVSQIKNTIIDLAIRFGPKLLVAVLILAVGATVSRWVSRWAARGLRHLELEPPVRGLLARIAWLLSFALFLILALQNLGVELLPLIAGLSVIGAGLALATQGVVSNLVAGLSIIFSKPFRVGEYISIVGEEGVVESITLFSTTLSHIDRSLVIIPNRKIVGEILHNFGRIRQLDVTVGLAYEADLGSTVQAIRELLKSNPHVLQDPPPVVQPNLLGDSSIVVAIRPWVPVQYFVSGTGEINSAVLELFRTRGIQMAIPQREIRLIGAAAPESSAIARQSRLTPR